MYLTTLRYDDRYEFHFFDSYSKARKLFNTEDVKHKNVKEIASLYNEVLDIYKCYDGIVEYKMFNDSIPI